MGFHTSAVPADGVSPLSNSHPSSTPADTAAAANTSIPDSLRLNLEEAGATTGFHTSAVPADGVSPLSNSHPSSTAAHTAAAANTSIPDSLRLLKVYLRTHALDKMVQAVTASAGIRMIKRVEQTLQDLGFVLNILNYGMRYSHCLTYRSSVLIEILTDPLSLIWVGLEVREQSNGTTSGSGMVLLTQPSVDYSTVRQNMAKEVPYIICSPMNIFNQSSNLMVYKAASHSQKLQDAIDAKWRWNGSCLLKLCDEMEQKGGLCRF